MGLADWIGRISGVACTLPDIKEAATGRLFRLSVFDPYDRGFCVNGIIGDGKYVLTTPRNLPTSRIV